MGSTQVYYLIIKDLFRTHSVNCYTCGSGQRLERWKYLIHGLPTSQVTATGSFVRSVCVVASRFFPSLNLAEQENDDRTAQQTLVKKLNVDNCWTICLN